MGRVKKTKPFQLEKEEEYRTWAPTPGDGGDLTWGLEVEAFAKELWGVLILSCKGSYGHIWWEDLERAETREKTLEHQVDSEAWRYCEQSDGGLN